MREFNRKTFFNLLASWMKNYSSFNEYGMSPGFHPPNSFDFQVLKNILKDKTFPEDFEDCYEITYAIHESEHGNLLKCHESVQVFVSTVLLYCHRKTNTIGDIDEAFYCIYANGLIEAKKQTILQGLLYLDWLKDHPFKAYPENDVFLLLAKILIQEASSLNYDQDIKYLEKLLNSDPDIQPYYLNCEQRWTTLLSKSKTPDKRTTQIFNEVFNMIDNDNWWDQ